MPAHWKDSLVLKVVNVLAFIVFTTSNAYSSLAPGQSIGGAQKITYITPAPWLFVVWPIIHALLLGALVYQFFPAGYGPVIETIGWRLPILALLTSIYSGFAAAQHSQTINSILAFVTILLVAGLVSHIYRDLRVKHENKNVFDVLFVSLPFSLFHGFVVVLVFVSAFSAFGREKDAHIAGAVIEAVVGMATGHKHPSSPIEVPDHGHQHYGPGIATNVLVFLSLLFLEATSAGYVFSGKGDAAGAAVITFSLLAIFQYQHTKFIHWSALVFFIISLIALVRALIATFQNRGRIALSDEERAPLVA
ncbi:unnamed protein product [Tilletia controversa]|uniref:Uncharacterized protein n=3 Tax=Tilletia TaxID=13289 RepID=A0A8X7MSW7_9BASI|nr:hypothetical protein CF336_g4360 [Tilletia laevis]KAE8196765.1 hypothetical protein CF328_g4044 [Tilletia controversa]KAE8260886.1 hypothetical protein A4X03_0g3682 [Tilletia caries]KAE8202465.1 hypothetical protein CF335_g3407 [Tilletia laevis]KAE8246959.1 hypothetical protein A4X06_0g4798 [Tilletia controversa]